MATIDGDRTGSLCTLVAQPYDLMTVCCDGMTGGIEELLVTTCQLTTAWSDCLSATLKPLPCFSTLG